MWQSRTSRMLKIIPAVAALALATGCTGLSDMDSAKETPMLPPHCNPTPTAADYPIPLGCTYVVNLHKMLEDPKDADAGRTLGPANGEREGAAVNAYRQNKIKSFDGEQNSTGGTSSTDISTERNQ
jgi:hypothetical protein